MAEKNNKTIFITGGCGFVGRQLIKYLLDDKEYNKVVVCCHRKEAAADLSFSGNRITIVEADLLHPESYIPLLKKFKPHDIVHLAAIARFRQGEENPDNTIKANFFGSLELLHLSTRFDVNRFLYVSSNLARNPKGVTGVSKYLTEAVIKKLEPLPTVISLRLPNVIDSPGAVTLIFKRQIEKGEAVTLTDKRMTRKFITPKQAAEDIMFALKNGNHQDVFVNNKPSTPIIKLAQDMINASGKKIPIEFVGIRPGEKLQEEDYPSNIILPTENKNIFILTNNQHTDENIDRAINLISSKLHDETINSIKDIFAQ